MKYLRYLIIGLFLAIIGLRIFLAFSSPTLSVDSYFTLRQVDHILEAGTPIKEDGLSYGGRAIVDNPIYAYILAFFSIPFAQNKEAIMGIMKIIPNITIMLIAIIFYLLGTFLTKSKAIGLLTAGMSLSIPIIFAETINNTIVYTVALLIFAETINNATVYTIVLPLVLLVNYLYILRQQSKLYLKYFLIAALFLVLLHPSAWIWLGGIGIFFMICWLERIAIKKWEREVLLSLFVLSATWTLLLYRKAFLVHGFTTLWQNTPILEQVNIFSTLSVLEFVTLVGIIPFIAAFWIFYDQIYRKKTKSVIFLVSQLASAFICIWFSFIPIQTGLLFLAITLLSLFPLALQSLFNYIHTTKFHNYDYLVWPIMIVLFILTSTIPTVIYTAEALDQALNVDIVNVAISAQEIGNEDAVFIMDPQDAQAFMAFSNKKTFADTNYLLANDVERRIANTEELYGATFGNTVLEIISEFSITNAYILYDASNPAYGSLLFAQDNECFSNVQQSNQVSLYRVNCQLVES